MRSVGLSNWISAPAIYEAGHMFDLVFMAGQLEAGGGD